MGVPDNLADNPELQHVDLNDRVELDRFEHPYEAELACGLLRTNGIACEVSSEVIPGVPGEVILWTRTKDAQVAWALLADSEREAARTRNHE
jgi:hypothetical protein